MKIRLNSATTLLLSTLVLIHPVTTFADEAIDDLVVVPKIAYTYKTVSFVIGDKKFSPFYQTLDLGLTTAFQSFYISANFDSSLKDHSELNTTRNGSGGYDNSIIQISRKDWALTGGYSVMPGVAIFGGYKYGENDVLVISNLYFNSGTPPNNLAISNSHVRVILEGPFLGGSYSFRFKNGSLDLSLAYAYMDGKFKNKAAVTANSDTSIEENTVNGTASGFSYGVVWSGPLAESFTYSTGIKTNRYRFDADNTVGDDEDVSFNEIHTIFFVGVSKYF